MYVDLYLKLRFCQMVFLFQWCRSRRGDSVWYGANAVGKNHFRLLTENGPDESVSDLFHGLVRDPYHAFCPVRGGGLYLGQCRGRFHGHDVFRARNDHVCASLSHDDLKTLC